MPSTAESHLARVDAAVASHWRVVLAVCAVVAQSVQVVRVLARPGRPALLDSIIMEYVGWRLARGATLYVDVWEVKPPLTFETPALVALVTGDDMVAYHVGVVLLTGAAAVGVALVVGHLVHRVTGDGVAAVAGGLAFFLLPKVALRAAIGYKPKYFVALAALLAIALALEDRPGLAGVAAAASVGYWQLAAGVPLVVLGVVAQRSGRRGLVRTCIGGAVATLVVLAPVLLGGPRAVEAMVVETVVAPLTTTDGGTSWHAPWKVLVWYGWGVLPGVAGVVGVTGVVWQRFRGRAWWAAAGFAWFLAGIVFVDFDNYPDAIPLVAFVAVGVGLAVAVAADHDRRLALGALVAVAGVVALNVGVLVVPGVVVHSTDPPESGVVADPATIEPPYDDAERRGLFWHGVESESCYYTGGAKVRTWVERTNGSRTDETCGRLPRG